MKKEKIKKHKLLLRHLTAEDYPQLAEMMDRVYDNLGGAWQKDQYISQVTRFPEGQIGIEDNGMLVAAAFSMIVDYAKFGDNHTYNQITGNGYLTHHTLEGDTLYGVDIFVHPKSRGLRLGRRLYDARKEICRNFNLRRFIAGGRIPGYAKYADSLTPVRYIEQVKSREIFDPVLSFQMANGFHVRKLLTGYLPVDGDSQGYATLLEWINLDYVDKTPELGDLKNVIRLGVVQWQMRPLASVDMLLKHAEFFIDAVAGYNADFVLFPEYISAPLMGSFNDKNPADAIRALAGFSRDIRDGLLEMAMSYNINIIAGSMPEYSHRELYNVSWLLRRDGTFEAQYKIHISVDEVAYWGVKGGDALKVFDTDCGKIAILISYDAEFPELARLAALQGAQIVFVPFWTDTKNAYQRVRYCSQARAIENECFVAIGGSVGNLPHAENMDIQYSQAAIFSPSDFAFPHDAILAEATPNTEMTLIADVNLELLKQARSRGASRNLSLRRQDLYRLEWQ
ncbi:hydrolase [Methylomonas lenta]|uniref:Hydrolase n=1 Tax=Methylomonas lenta TaxID=980561 RepID=A0A177ND02_9GAMM|nr:bifunctional GNAT family N-acetyltransferase/carbon-nitrogen hydrolase family protein [Methylomonas lenta]OAI15936.1 hydrolase [Methylomonas lenta]